MESKDSEQPIYFGYSLEELATIYVYSKWVPPLEMIMLKNTANELLQNFYALKNSKENQEGKFVTWKGTTYTNTIFCVNLVDIHSIIVRDSKNTDFEEKVEYRDLDEDEDFDDEDDYNSI